MHAFVSNCGTYYSNGHLAIGNKKNRLQGSEYVKTIVLAHNSNALIIVFYS